MKCSTSSNSRKFSPAKVSGYTVWDLLNIAATSLLFIIHMHKILLYICNLFYEPSLSDTIQNSY